MSDVSSKRMLIYEYVSRKIRKDGYPPSTREICDAVGLRSPSTVHGHIQALIEQGLLEKDPGKNRTLKIVGPQLDEKWINIPVVGQVTAGIPILAVEQIEGYIPFPEQRASGKELFALVIKGDSMIGAGILDGDVVVVQRTSSAENGQIVVALIEDEATCKRFRMEGGHIKLIAENPNYAPIERDDASILGKVIASMRYYNDRKNLYNN